MKIKCKCGANQKVKKLSIWKTKKDTYIVKGKCAKCKAELKLDVSREEVIQIAKENDLILQYE